MAPLRRYLRITRYSVLEVRIYLENPSLASTWLLNPRDPVLPRIITSVRPLVLPKLREENERAQGGKKGGKKKGVRDIVVEDDFEVSIFLTDLSTRHSLLTKQKAFSAKPERLRSNSGKLTGWLNSGTKEAPHMIAEADNPPAILREEESEEVGMEQIPAADENEGDAEIDDGATNSRTQKRKRGRQNGTGNEEEALFVSSSDSESFQTQASPASRKRRKPYTISAEDGDDEDPQAPDDDKKKLALNTAYDGFSIYGRILCLVVKRRGGKGKQAPGGGPGGGQAMMENWVSTQAQQELGIEDD